MGEEFPHLLLRGKKMNINGIHVNQGRQAIRQTEKTEYAITIKKDASSVPARLNSDVSPNEARSVQVQSQGIINHIDYLQEQLNSLLTHYPPFFPAGSPQRPDLIQKVKGIQEEIEKISAGTGDKRTSSGDRKLREDATDAEIATALEGFADFKKEVSRNSHLMTGKTQPGAFINVKI